MTDKIKVIGNLDNPGYECINRVYDINGICPTITNMQGGGRQPKIMVDTVQIKQATKQGYIPCEVGGGGEFEFP